MCNNIIPKFSLILGRSAPLVSCSQMRGDEYTCTRQKRANVMLASGRTLVRVRLSSAVPNLKDLDLVWTGQAHLVSRNEPSVNDRKRSSVLVSIVETYYSTRYTESYIQNHHPPLRKRSLLSSVFILERNNLFLNVYCAMNVSHCLTCRPIQRMHWKWSSSSPVRFLFLDFSRNFLNRKCLQYFYCLCFKQFWAANGTPDTWRCLQPSKQNPGSFILVSALRYCARQKQQGPLSISDQKQPVSNSFQSLQNVVHIDWYCSGVHPHDILQKRRRWI